MAAVGYVVQFLAARVLGAADYAEFAVFWSLLFVVVGLLSGVAQEVIRVSRIAKLRIDDGLEPEPHELRRPRIGLVAVSVGVGTAVVVFALGFVVGPPLLGDDWLVE